MVKFCIFNGCKKRPTFNLPTETKAIYCFEHKKENMIDVKHKQCQENGCNKHPTFNLPTESKAIYCFEHKKENMINVKDKRCQENGCDKIPTFNLPTGTRAIYCFEHKKENMINVKHKRCQELKCKNDAIFGLSNKHPQYCNLHKKPNMINAYLYNKCSILDCDEQYEFIIDNTKYCLSHSPKQYEINIKRLCKYCDILEESKFICNNCKKISHKKEWSIVRYLRKVIDTKFEYDSSKMLNGCSKKRPDIYFELSKHCVIVEIDENQHKTYEDICECARINEIVNGIGGKSVIIIRYNPDIVRNNGKEIILTNKERLDTLVKIIKEELVKDYDKFIVKTIQIYYDDNNEKYEKIKEENITKLVCV